MAAEILQRWSISDTAEYGDYTTGAPDFTRLRAQAEAHPIEETGRTLRGLMSWVSGDDDYTGTAARH